MIDHVCVYLHIKNHSDLTQRWTQAITQNGTLEGTFNRGYTVDGVTMFNTLAAMAASLEEDRVKAELAIASEATVIEEVLNAD